MARILHNSAKICLVGVGVNVAPTPHVTPWPGPARRLPVTTHPYFPWTRAESRDTSGRREGLGFLFLLCPILFLLFLIPIFWILSAPVIQIEHDTSKKETVKKWKARCGLVEYFANTIVLTFITISVNIPYSQHPSRTVIPLRASIFFVYFCTLCRCLTPWMFAEWMNEPIK